MDLKSKVFSRCSANYYASWQSVASLDTDRSLPLIGLIQRVVREVNLRAILTKHAGSIPLSQNIWQIWRHHLKII